MSQKFDTMDYMKAKMTQEQFQGYLLGNVIEHTASHQGKEDLADLKRARVFLDKLIAEYEGSEPAQEPTAKTAAPPAASLPDV